MGEWDEKQCKPAAEVRPEEVGNTRRVCGRSLWKDEMRGGKGLVQGSVC